MTQLFAAMLTPFTSPAGEIDHAWIPPFLRWLEAQGLDGVVPGGTTGEGPSMSVAERQALIDTVMANRGHLRVIPGTGCAALSDTIALTRYAIERGAEAALVLPPFYFKPVSDAGLLAFYRALCDALPPAGRIMLYHIPPISHIAINTALIDGMLESHPERLYGLKDSGRDAAYTELLARRYPNLHIFTGTSSQFAESLAAGAAGGIFALANAFPRELRAVADAFAAAAGVEAAQRLVSTIESTLKPWPTIPALKALMPGRADLPTPAARPPLLGLVEPEIASMLERLALATSA